MFLKRKHLLTILLINLALCQGYRETVGTENVWQNPEKNTENLDPARVFDCEVNDPSTSSIGLKTDCKGIPRTVTSAGVFKGSLMTSRKGRNFQAYRGIRYAESPTGEMRFQPPKPICHYETEVDASQEGPACPTLAAEYYYGNFSEDCLRLNVYTPATNSGAALPVIVYIHSGGFYSMSGRSDLHGPHYLLDRDLVLVTINYRLGSLGFLSTGDELAPGNNGMKDQVTALRWVKRNIRAFGGDPELVTLAGCSAGSISVNLHMISPMTRGLFQRAISVSGSGETGKEPIPRHQRNLAVKQAELLNCPTDSSKAIIDCLKTKTWREIGDSLLGFYEFAYDPTLFWQPLNELDFGQPRYLTTDPLDAILSKDMVTVPYIITQTEREFYWKAFTILRNETFLNQMNANWTGIAPVSFQLPRGTSSLDSRSSEVVSELKRSFLGGRELQNDRASAEGLGTLYGDSIIGFTVHRLANLMARYSEHPVYYGLFSYVGDHSHYEDPVTKKPIGAMHHDDLIYLFTLRYLWPDISVASPHGAFVDVMTALWYHFAKYGDMTPRGDIPELTSLHWPAMTPDDRKYLRLDSSLNVERNMFENRFDVWDRLYPVTSS